MHTKENSFLFSASWCKYYILTHLFLSRKVFKKLGFELSDEVIRNITSCKQWAAEQLLLMLREKMSSVDSIQIHQVSPPNSGIGDRLEHGQLTILCHFRASFL